MLSTFRYALGRSGLASTGSALRVSHHVSKSSTATTLASLARCPGCLHPISRSLAARNFSSSLNQLRHSKLLKKTSSLWRVVPAVRQTVTQAASNVPGKVPARGERIVGAWLLGCAGMCFGAVILGGVTRLTESGLSMVDWRLIKDMRAPRSEQEWMEEFERYKAFPEYKYLNKDKEMTLADFKFIFYMEFYHRLWGRTLGMVFILPALYFLRKGWISRAMKPRLAIYTALIGFQGFMGWYMVKSGLQDKPESMDIPRVSQYRLATHLGSAIILYALMLWGGLSCLNKPVPLPSTKQISKIRILSHGVMSAIFITAISGAFVAGLDAGLVYNSWPKMADRWIPDDLAAFSPKWKNIFENPTTVQFNHRHLAECTMVVIAGFWWMCRKAPLHPRARLAVNCLLGMSFVQFALGVTTLLTYVPTPWAATHQSGSLVLLGCAIWFAQELRRLPK